MSGNPVTIDVPQFQDFGVTLMYEPEYQALLTSQESCEMELDSSLLLSTEALQA